MLTRWNSDFQMFNWFLDNMLAVNQYCNEYYCERFTKEDFALIKDLVHLLQPFQEVVFYYFILKF